MNDRLLSFLGLCRRAGCMIIGADTVVKAIGERRALLVLLAADLSPNSSRDIEYAARQAGVELRTLSRSKDELSFALGRRCGALCVTDKGFADKILMMVNG